MEENIINKITNKLEEFESNHLIGKFRILTDGECDEAGHQLIRYLNMTEYYRGCRKWIDSWLIVQEKNKDYGWNAFRLDELVDLVNTKGEESLAHILNNTRRIPHL